MTSDEQIVEHLELLTTGGSNITYIREGIALIKRLQALADALYGVLDECFNAEGMFVFEEDSMIDSVVEVKARYQEMTQR